jgi:AraC family transcriptional regulator
MNYFKQLEKAILYIEKNLKAKIRLDDIAEEIHLSKYHFHRIFHAIVGETVYDYIRNRRITNASDELLNSDKKIVDVSFDYQFESQEAFTRSFKAIYHMTPAKYRKEKLKKMVFRKNEYNKERLHHIISGITKEPIIVEKDEIKIIGMATKTSLINNSIPKLWNAFLKHKDKIQNKTHPEIIIGAGYKANNFNSFDFHENTTFQYVVGKKITDIINIPEGMELIKIPTCKYAVFRHKGKFDKFGLSYVYIYGSWFPKSGYKVSNSPDLEWYDNRFLGADDDNSEIDIYISIE